MTFHWRRLADLVVRVAFHTSRINLVSNLVLNVDLVRDHHTARPEALGIAKVSTGCGLHQITGAGIGANYNNKQI